MNNNKFLKFYLIIFVLFTFIGTVANYSFLPEADLWAIFERVYQLQEGNFYSLWNQHNEHRPAISFLLAYIDQKFFFGKFYFLYFFSFFSFIFSFFIFKNIFKEKVKKDNYHFFLIVLTTLMFFWSQKPNFIFPFHVSIILVNLLTLSSLVLFDRYLITSKIIFFIYSIALSVLAIFTMASGVFSIWILFVLSLYKKRASEAILFFLLGLLLSLIYFLNFKMSNGFEFSKILHILNFIKIYFYFFGYLGSIFSFIVGKGIFGLSVAIIFGHFLFLGLLKKIIDEIKENNNLYFLLFFIIFIFIGAGLTSIGRFQDGVQHSISSRYTTNSIFAWISIIILFYKDVTLFLNKSSLKIKIKNSFYFLLFLFSFYQLRTLAVDFDSKKILNRSQDLIALTLGLDNENKKIPHLNSNNILSYIDKKLFLFRRDLFLPKASLDTIFNKNNSFYLKKNNKLNIQNSSENSYSQVSFIVVDFSPDIVYFKTEKGNIVGYAISENNFSFFDRREKLFKGYYLGAAINNVVFY